MKFECPNCKKSGQVDDSKVPDTGVYATCPQCNNKFLIKREAPIDFQFEPIPNQTSNVSEIKTSPPKQPYIKTNISQDEQKPFGILAASLISLLVMIVLNLAIHIPYIAVTDAQMAMGPLSRINVIVLGITFFTLYKKRYSALMISAVVVVTAIIAFVATIVIFSPAKTSAKPEAATSSVTASHANSNKPPPVASYQTPSKTSYSTILAHYGLPNKKYYGYDLEAAQRKGYTVRDVNNILAADLNYDIAGARAAYYTEYDLIEYFMIKKSIIYLANKHNVDLTNYRRNKTEQIVMYDYLISLENASGGAR